MSNNAKITSYVSFISSSLSSSFGTINLYDLAHIISLYEYKELVFSNSSILSLSIKNNGLDIITITNDKKYQFFNSPYKLLCFIDSLKWRIYKDNFDQFYENYIIIETNRNLIKDDNGVLAKNETDNFYYLYKFNLENNVVFLENYDGKIILYAEFEKVELVDILSKFAIFIE